MKRTRSPRNNNIARIVKGLLAVSERSQRDLGSALDLSDSAISRKLSSGEWDVDDLDVLAQFFDVSLSTFFRDPTDLFGPAEQGGSSTIWDDASEIPEISAVPA